MNGETQVELFTRQEQDDDNDCCMIAAHRANERFRQRQFTPEERKEIAECFERLKTRLGLAAP